ncbi:MAG TPA: hypothetical protein VLC09_06790 [Polyangiaceae bacterium]|nr:hypothetical protein [Polyangiaceae bacterium]
MKLDARWVLLSSCLTVACGGSAPPPTQTPDQPVDCPAGQRYERGYCLADKSEPAPVASTTAKDERPVEPAPTTPTSTTTTPTTTTVEPTPVVTPPKTDEKKLAAPVDLSMAASAAPLIQYLSAAHLPAGARPFGAAFAGQFAEGQVLEQRVQLTAGKCYTVVAAGLPPVREVDLALYLQEGEGHAATALATDKEAGAQAVLGRKTECFRPTDAQKNLVLVVSVPQGQGVAAAQMFEK